MTESHPGDNAADQPSRPGPFRPVLFIAIVFFAVALIYVVAQTAAPGERIAWQSDLPRARAEAEATGKQVLVYFTADWYAPCQQMKRTVFADAKVDQALRLHIPVKIDIDDQPVMARKYKVESIPYFAILDADGEIDSATGGAMSSDEFIAWIKRASRKRIEW